MPRPCDDDHDDHDDHDAPHRHDGYARALLILSTESSFRLEC